jgi:peptidoglycan/xylan/chitin deacetylase (PgdA/CDA1 family)
VIFRGIPNKRVFLAQVLCRIGAVGLLERALAAFRPALLVLTYHRIAEPGGDPFYDPVISATPESFRAQIKWLSRRFRILTLDELVDGIHKGGLWKEPAVFLTFDDGYRDNFDEAVPVLRQFQVPATFFIPTDFFEAPRLPWWDHVAYVIKQTQTRRLDLKRSERDGESHLSIDLDQATRNTAIMTIVRAILDETVADLAWFLNQLSAQAEVVVDEQSLSRALFMSWDQIRQLADSKTGLTIGSHAHSHEKLAGLDGESQRRELALSRQILEKRVGREVRALAYPYGWPGTYNAVTKSTARETGYRLAFCSRPGVNRPGTFDPFEVNRLGVGSGDSVDLLRARAALFSALGRSVL